jgi:hypothetical protein
MTAQRERRIIGAEPAKAALEIPKINNLTKEVGRD